MQKTALLKALILRMTPNQTGGTWQEIAEQDQIQERIEEQIADICTVNGVEMLESGFQWDGTGQGVEAEVRLDLDPRQLQALMVAYDGARWPAEMRANRGIRQAMVELGHDLRQWRRAQEVADGLLNIPDDTRTEMLDELGFERKGEA